MVGIGNKERFLLSIIFVYLYGKIDTLVHPQKNIQEYLTVLKRQERQVGYIYPLIKNQQKVGKIAVAL